MTPVSASFLLRSRSRFAVQGHVGGHGGEVEAVGTVELALDEAGRNDAAAEIDDLVGHDEFIVKGRLAADDLARGRADPDAIPHEGITAEEAAVGELGDAVVAGGGERTREGMAAGLRGAVVGDGGRGVQAAAGMRPPGFLLGVHAITIPREGDGRQRLLKYHSKALSSRNRGRTKR